MCRQLCYRARTDAAIWEKHEDRKVTEGCWTGGTLSIDELLAVVVDVTNERLLTGLDFWGS